MSEPTPAADAAGRSRLAEWTHFALVVVLTAALAALLCYVSTRRYVRMDWRSTAQQPLTHDTLALLVPRAAARPGRHRPRPPLPAGRR